MNKKANELPCTCNNKTSINKKYQMTKKLTFNTLVKK